MTPLIDERLQSAIDPPSVDDQRAQRLLQREKLEAWFSAHHGVEAEAVELERIAGPNYRSRLCEMAFKVKNVPRWTVLSDGRKRKDRGAYVYRPEQIGREAGDYIPQPELF